MERPEPYLDFDLTDRPGEVWKDVPGWEDYAVSNQGRVKSLARTVSTKNQNAEFTYERAGRVMRITKTTGIYNGFYLRVQLRRLNSFKSIMVHTLVMAAFVGERIEGMQINHINGVKNDNNLVNLEYCTQSENLLHAIRTGLKPVGCGTKAPNSKLSHAEVAEVKRHFSGKRPTHKECLKFGAKFGTHYATIYNIVIGKSHKELVT